jgi:hypothetical protein
VNINQQQRKKMLPSRRNWRKRCIESMAMYRGRDYFPMSKNGSIRASQMPTIKNVIGMYSIRCCLSYNTFSYLFCHSARYEYRVGHIHASAVPCCFPAFRECYGVSRGTCENMVSQIKDLKHGMFFVIMTYTPWFSFCFFSSPTTYV